MSGVRAGLSGVKQPLYVEFHVLSTSKAAVLPPTVENSSVNIGSYVEFSGFSKHKPPLKKPKTSVTKWFVWLTSTPACRHLPRSIRRGRSSQQKQKTYFNSNSETNEHEPAVCRRYNDTTWLQGSRTCTSGEEILVGWNLNDDETLVDQPNFMHDLHLQLQ